MKAVRIATRKSPLALWQAEHVAARLRALHSGLEVTLVEMSTAGDRFLQAPLSTIGGKGLFVKEIEQALLDGRADVAVHSLKDLTSFMPEALCLAATPEREDPRDAFVGLTAKSVAELPQGARIGTSSLRRGCLLLERRPDFKLVSLRGNVQSRLRKTEEQNLDGTVLAYAGLKRLGLAARVTEVLTAEQSLPAVGQGVLAVQCRRADAEILRLLAPLDDVTTRTAVAAERAFLASLEGGCSVPIAAYAEVEGDALWVRGLIGSPDGTRVVRGERRGKTSEAPELGAALANELSARGGDEILRSVRG